mgnify:CR=1 FL=1
MRLFQLGSLVVFLGIVGCVGEAGESGEPEETAQDTGGVEVSEGSVAPAKIKVEMCACKDAQCGPTQGAECSSKR